MTGPKPPNVIDLSVYVVMEELASSWGVVQSGCTMGVATSHSCILVVLTAGGPLVHHGHNQADHHTLFPYASGVALDQSILLFASPYAT